MALNDLLLTLASYPDPTPVTVIEDAVSVASVSALISQRLPAKCMLRCPATSFQVRRSGYPASSPARRARAEETRGT